jgi:hypothetical protein
MNQKNKDLPAMPVHPMQDKFGQVILMAGMTKLEKAALDILCSQLRKNKIEDLSTGDISNLIFDSYFIAEQFCSHQEDKNKTESNIII